MTQRGGGHPCPRKAVGGSHPLRMLGATALLALVSACAAEGPQIPATQEAAQYRSRAQTYYHPPGPAWDPWGPYVTEASKRFDVPEVWIRSVMKRESAGQEFAVSAPGAMGLMQVMPFTYDLMREQYSLEDDPYDPRNNILAGTAYIRQMYDIYGSPGFLAAYNAGPGRLDDFLTRNRPLPAETRRYVAAIGPEIAFDSPHSRSQADLMAMNHVAPQDQLAQGGPTPRDPALSHDVSLAWARRGEHGGSDAATAAPSEPALADATPSRPIVLAASDGAAAGGSVASVWAHRMGTVPAMRPVEPVQVARAAPSRFVPAPTPNQTTPTENAVQLASARENVEPSRELADSVADAPDQAQAAMPDPYVQAPVRRVRTRYTLAMAQGPRPVAAAAAGGQWAIQVGAFGSAGAANQAAGDARHQVHGLLGAAHPEVASLHDRRGRIYRARLTGLSHEAAVHACQRLGNCMVVSPERS